MELLLGIIVVVVIGYFFFRKKVKPSQQLSAEDLLDPETKEFVENRKKLDRPYSDFIDSSLEPPQLLAELREKHKDQSLSKLNDLYYSLLTKIQEEKKNRDFKKMTMYSQMSLGLIEPLILQNKIAYGSFDLGSIPALEEPLSYYAINGHGGQIKNIEEIVDFFPELSAWKEVVNGAKETASLSASLMKVVNDNPGTLQKDIKKLINIEDGKKVANVLYYMELYGKIRKEKSGNTNQLFIAQ
jgi:hypothetical protein